MKKIINWKIFFILLVLSLISVLSVFPYVLTLQGDVIKSVGIPLEAMIVAQLIQALILFSIVIFFGLLFTKKIGFKLPLLEALVEKGTFKSTFNRIFRQSIFLGIVIAALIYAVDALFTLLGAGVTTHQSLAPVWQKLLAAFYGGITEEILMRLFLMALLIWLSQKLFRKNQPTPVGIWVSIMLAAVIFGLGHLPITAALTTITPLVIARAIVLNGIGGVIFGYLFWKKGLESAMLAHFTTDIFLLTLLPLVIK